jgi:hypothetical protein
MVRQELKPVRPSCWFGVDFIIFEDKEVTAALNKNVNLFFLHLRLTVFLVVAGRG